MYFHSRIEAGHKLAAELTQYRYGPSTVMALNDGAVLVGEPIARELGCRLTVLLSEGVPLPGEHLTIGTVGQGGSFTYNRSLSPGEVEEYYSEYHGYIEDQKREKFAKMNRLLGQGGELNLSMLKEHTIILISDGLKTGISLDSALEFLKPVKIKRLIIATPIASVQAVDRMHILADELHCLSVTDNFISINHYYDDNTIPDHDEIVTRIKHFEEGAL